MAFILGQPGVSKEGAVMSGYSFGAMVAVGAGYERAEIARIVAVALPLAMVDARIPDNASKPVLLVSGDRDSYSPVAGLQALKAKIGESARLEIIAGADHFFGGSEAELSRVLAGGLTT
jgi:alpha/beta superfamily hydrolase